MFSAVGWICVQEAEYADEFGDPSIHPREATLAAIEAELDRLVPPQRMMWPHRSLRFRLGPLRQSYWRTFPNAPHSGPQATFLSDNGTWTVLVNTHRNHRQEWPLQLFHQVARLAPGSFGYMHVWDDEHPSERQTFMRWSMVLGEVSVVEDLALRPVSRVMWDHPGPEA